MKSKKKKKDKHQIFAPESDLGFDELYLGYDDRDRNVASVAREIRRRIQNGATEDDISWYKFKTLKDTLSFFRVVGRAKLTTKEEMAERLIRVLKSEDTHGTYSKKFDKDEHFDEDEFISLQNKVISEIKREGGI